MKVTEIEVHDITLEYCDWTSYQLNHHYGPVYRTVYVAHTDDGCVGLGESREREPEEVIDQYVGSNPFEWIGDETSLGLGTAMYDLMGKIAGVPVHKLFGQKYRSWVPVGSWTVSTDPRRMAAAVTTYAGQGYTWMKFHLSPFENVLDQTEAMQEVAPEGFRIHYDFTNHGTDDHMPELLEKLAAYKIAGCFEDPLPGADIDGYCELRRRARRPIVLHHYPMEATYEVYRRPADVYMLGYMKIGDTVRRAGLFAAADTPFMMQNVGGPYHPGYDRAYDGCFPIGELPFVVRRRDLEERCRQRAPRACQWFLARAGRARPRRQSRPERARTAGGSEPSQTR